jgi:hypothetical protein
MTYEQNRGSEQRNENDSSSENLKENRKTINSSHELSDMIDEYLNEKDEEKRKNLADKMMKNKIRR